jgi:hypothetical protein
MNNKNKNEVSYFDISATAVLKAEHFVRWININVNI